MPLSPEARSIRGRLARADQLERTDAAEDLRRDFRFVRARDYIRDVVESAPPLTDEQRRQLASLLAEEGAHASA